MKLKLNQILQYNKILSQFREKQILINLNYSLIITLKDLHNKHHFFQKCNSLQEVLELILKFLNDKKGFIKEINNSEIILGIHDQNNDDILFYLVKRPFNYINPNLSLINNYSEKMANINPMARKNKNIHIKEGSF